MKFCQAVKRETLAGIAREGLAWRLRAKQEHAGALTLNHESKTQRAGMRSAEAWRQRVDQAVADLSRRVEKLESPVPG